MAFQQACCLLPGGDAVALWAAAREGILSLDIHLSKLNFFWSDVELTEPLLVQCNLTACFELPPAADTELQPQRSGGEGTVLLAGPAVLRGVGGLLVLLQRPFLWGLVRMGWRNVRPALSFEVVGLGMAVFVWALRCSAGNAQSETWATVWNGLPHDFVSSLNETQGVFPILGPGFAAAACRVVPSPGSCGSEWGGWKSRGGRGFGVAMGKPWYVCQEWSQPCAELSAMCCHLWGEWRPAHVVLSTGLSSCGVTFQLRVLQKLGVAGANGCLPCDRWDAKVKESSRAGTHVTRFSVQLDGSLPWPCGQGWSCERGHCAPSLGRVTQGLSVATGQYGL